MERKILPYLVVVSAISVSLSAAFYSVTGIGKMFSGAAYQVMIMMGSLEIAKLVLASLLYQYWDKLNRLLKFYYFVALFVLMAITSAGIYGYLSSAYAETSNKVENISKNVSVLDIKRQMYQSQLDDIKSEKQKINDNIDNLTKGLSNNYIQTKDRKGQIITTTSSSNRKSFESQLLISQKRRDDISLKEVALSDSIAKIDLNKLDLETNSDVASEIGSLKYISKITGKPVDTVVNWFIIALMLVFDPLAVSLVVGANVIFKSDGKEKEKLKESEKIDEKIENFNKRELEFNKLNEDYESKLSEIELQKKEIEDKNIKLENERKSFLNMKESLEKEIEDERYNMNSQFQIEKDRIHKDQLNLIDESNKFKLEKEEFLSNKDKMSKIIKKLKEDREDIDNSYSKLETLKKELSDKEKYIDKVKDDLVQLDEEIKNWEGSHWKLKRNPPPSAILD